MDFVWGVGRGFYLHTKRGFGCNEPDLIPKQTSGVNFERCNIFGVWVMRYMCYFNGYIMISDNERWEPAAMKLVRL